MVVEILTETSSLITLKIMPRNLIEIVRSWIQLQEEKQHERQEEGKARKARQEKAGGKAREKVEVKAEGKCVDGRVAKREKRGNTEKDEDNLLPKAKYAYSTHTDR